MNRRYESYCLGDPTFYESPTVASRGDREFAVAGRPIPDDWERFEIDDWFVYAPRGVRLPRQGWKVHASACLANAEDVLAATWDYCVPRRIPFKFVRGERSLLLRNAKSADRGSSGKLATLYPVDDAQLEVVLDQLGAVLDGQPGPYVLSDLRWGRGPLYVRYGGFAARFCVGPDGEPEPAIEDGSGQLVPDRRGPTFEVPAWVTLPQSLRPHLAARDAATLEELPYEITSALHFSNGGGVYRAVDRRSGEQVVLKEARPHAGLSADGLDAVARSRREREILERLDGLDAVLPLRGSFIHGEHHFMVQPFVEGSTLAKLFVERYPLVSRAPQERAIADHTSWAIGVLGRVERAVATVHERGVVVGDLHPSNLLIRSDGRVVIVDWEVASTATDGQRPSLGSVAFAAPAGRSGFDVDRYALACLRLYLFLPLTTLFRLDDGKARELAAEVAELFPVPRAFVSDAVRVITGAAAPLPRRDSRPRFDPSPSAWLQTRDAMAEAILSSATPNRDDRLFPGDVAQFDPCGGLNIAHGAAGVLYALAAVGAGSFPEHEAWLVEQAGKPQARSRLGFYDGLHGVAYVLDRLGRRRDALNVLDVCLDRPQDDWAREPLGHFGGLAGIGLNLAYFARATGESSLLEKARRIADVVARRLGDEESVGEVSGHGRPHAGLMRGSSGPALLFLGLYEERADIDLLDLAAVALRQDLRRCVRAGDGALHVNEGWRTMPYLADGSAGIGIVLDRYLTHRDDEGFRDAQKAIRHAAQAQFYAQSGLFAGRAGMILLLSSTHPPGSAGFDPAVAAQLRRLAWHAMTYRDRLAFPGDHLLRLSMDLATGTAGVLLAMGAALHGEPVHLPFLAPPGYKRPSGNVEENEEGVAT